MSAKHTPGPWRYDAETMTVRVQDFKRNQFMGDYRGCIIAGFEESHGGQCRMESLERDGYAMREAVEANARLIAAAPELLETAKKLRETINYWAENPRPDEWILQEWVHILDDSIARAEGSQP